jgi:hypothetical protein
MHSLNINIYKPDESLFSFKIVILLILLISVFVLSRFFIQIGFIWLLMILPFILIAFSFFDKQKSIGNISIDESRLNITNGEEKRFNLNELDQIKLTYIGFKGKKHIYDFIPRRNEFSGSDNMLEFYYRGTPYRFKFMINDLQEEKEFLNLIHLWQARGYVEEENIKLNI